MVYELDGVLEAAEEFELRLLLKGRIAISLTSVCISFHRGDLVFEYELSQTLLLSGHVCVGVIL